MNQLQQRFQRAATIYARQRTATANVASFSAANAATAGASGLVCIANDHPADTAFVVTQKNSLFISFGRYPHAKGLQIFDRESAELIAAAMSAVDVKAGALSAPSVPIYFGHPDVPGRADSNPAAPAMGWVESANVSGSGLTLNVKWSPDGAAAIANGHFRYYSPNWLLRRVKGGIQPVKLLSVGLTNVPNIPVPSLANSRTAAANDAAEIRTAERSKQFRATLATVQKEFPRAAYDAQFTIAQRRFAQP